MTGDGFRSFFEESTYTSSLSKELTNAGKLQPLFLTIWLWANAFVREFKPDQHVFIDGYPRRLEEAVAVDSAISFYGRTDVVVLNFVVSRETSKGRMLSRARSDDTPANIEERLNWYDTEVTPAVEFFRNKPGYTFIDIDGEKPIDEIHKDIISKLNLA